jgi:hypothetical protein
VQVMVLLWYNRACRVICCNHFCTFHMSACTSCTCTASKCFHQPNPVDIMWVCCAPAAQQSSVGFFS